MPGSVLGVRDMSVNKLEKRYGFMELIFSVLAYSVQKRERYINVNILK